MNFSVKQGKRSKVFKLAQSIKHVPIFLENPLFKYDYILLFILLSEGKIYYRKRQHMYY